MLPAATHPLIMVEVIPLMTSDIYDKGVGINECRKGSAVYKNCLPTISSPAARLQLLNMSRQRMFSKGWSGIGYGENVDRRMRGKDYSDEDEHYTGQPRGLLLKSNVHPCQHCSYGEGIEPNQDFKSTIISGDVVFLGNIANNDAKLRSSESIASIPATYLQSDDPLDEIGVPCYLRGYIEIKSPHLNGHCHSKIAHHSCAVVSGTAVHICDPIDVRKVREMAIGSRKLEPGNVSLHSIISGRSNTDIHSYNKPAEAMKNTENKPIYSALKCFNRETIESLSLRMSTMLANTVWIGTTPCALSTRKLQHQESEAMEDEVSSFWEIHSNEFISNDDGADIRYNEPHMNPYTKTQERRNPVPLLLREGAILIHNSHPNSGKTTLVTTIAKDILKCDAVHLISAPALFAKYGTSADAALESMLHELTLQCAVKGCAESTTAEVKTKNTEEQEHPGEVPKLCIILDNLESFLPLSRQAGGDPYLPVLNAIAAYLNRLSFSLKARNQFPFPSNNPLYNLDSTASGFTLPLGICMVGVATCLESNREGSAFQNALDTIGGGRFRFPLPSAATRLSAFDHAFVVCGVHLSTEAKKSLPELAAKATWASGGAFLDIAKELYTDMKRTGTYVVSNLDLQRAMIRGRDQSNAEYTADFTSQSTSSGTATTITFSSVGGNIEAKLALEDALALDPVKRCLLSKFGLQTPTGVLMYGPPGTGKTLLARAVSQTLCEEDGKQIGNVGGAFVALKASDIVRPEVGNSEKLIVSAFETARLNAPSVIFIDEFQALFGDREGSGFILGQLASTLLQCMDDISRWSEAVPLSGSDSNKGTPQNNGRIVVLAATNTPWMIDKAFLRPGRFDRTVHVGLPNVEDSEEILRVHVSHMKLAPLPTGLSPVDEICKSMAKLCLGFSGADLAALCRAAAIRSLSSGSVVSGITEQNFHDAYMYDVMRSSDDKLVRRISSWQP